jgi:hypothetical protein
MTDLIEIIFKKCDENLQLLTVHNNTFMIFYHVFLKGEHLGSFFVTKDKPNLIRMSTSRNYEDMKASGDFENATAEVDLNDFTQEETNLKIKKTFKTRFTF